MSTASVADLLSPPTADAIESLLLAYLTVAANPVTDWNSGAVQLTMMKIELEILIDMLGPGSPPALRSALAGLVANGYPDEATGDSLKTIAKGWYGINDISAGSFAVQTVTMACDSSHGPYTFTAGLQGATASDGAAYVVAGSGTLSTGGTLTLDFNARSVGLAKALISVIAGGLPGVTVQSAAIKVSGGVPQFGSDPTTDDSIAAEIAGRFPSLEAVGDEDRVITWAKASDASITRCRIDCDQNLAGGVVLTVAGPTGPVAGSAVTNAQGEILKRQPITDNISVNNATAVAITPGGTVFVAAGRLAATQAAADAAWAEYLATSQIGTNVYLLQLTKAVMDAGADNFTSPTLNGLAQDQTLASFAVPVAAGTLTALLTWVAT